MPNEFLIQAVIVFRPQIYFFDAYIFFFQFPFKNRNQFFQILLTLLVFFLDVSHQPAMFVRIGVWKSKVFKLSFQFAHPEPIGDRRVNFQCFKGDSFLLFFPDKIQGLHVVMAVGKFNQDHPDVFGHRQKHFSQIFHAPFNALIFDFAEFRDSVD